MVFSKMLGCESALNCRTTGGRTTGKMGKAGQVGDAIATRLSGNHCFLIPLQGPALLNVLFGPGSHRAGFG
jgi:hypothetical protein